MAQSNQLPCRRAPRWLPTLLIVLCCLQPVLDALSYWQDALGLSGSITLIPRAALLLFLAAAGFVLSERKRSYVVMFALLGSFWLCHCAVCLQNGYETWMTDFSNYLRVLQLPITAIFMITCLKRSDACFSALFRGFFAALLVIAALEVLALVTGTEPYTYPDKQIGLRGWCFWPNAQSAILSLLAPICIVYALRRWPNKPVLCGAVILLCLGGLFLHGTRLSYFCLMVTGFGLVITLLILRQKKTYVLILLAVTIAFGACFPISPMYRNQQRVAENAEKKAQIFTDLVAIGEQEAQAQGLEGQEYEIARLRLGYSYYCSELVARFGIEKVLDAYDYTEDVSTIISERTWKLKFCQLLMEDSTPASRVFGLSVGRMIYNGLSHDCENDFHGIYYLYGWAGLAMMLAFLGYFLWLILKAMVTAPKRYFTLEAAGYGIALITLFVHIYFTCGVLRRSNTLFYFGVVLAVIYYLVKLRIYPEAAEGSRSNPTKK